MIIPLSFNELKYCLWLLPKDTKFLVIFQNLKAITWNYIESYYFKLWGLFLFLNMLKVIFVLSG